MRFLLIWLLLAFGGLGTVAAGLQQSSGAQEPSTRFRARIDQVEVHAVVTDTQGRVVPGLTKEDFEVYEDGVLQATTSFVPVNVPLATEAAPAAAHVESDVRSTARDGDRRLYILILDDLHTDPTRSQLVREAATRFVEQYLGADDLGAVVYSSGSDDKAQNITSSRSRLAASIGRFIGQKLPSSGAERLAIHLRTQALTSVDDPSAAAVRTNERLDQARSIVDPYDSERGMRARRLMECLRGVADRLIEVRDRRTAVLLFSEGVDYDIYEPFNRGSATAIIEDVRSAVAAAQRAGVTVYSVDPRGLTGVSDVAARGGSETFPQLEFGGPRGALRELLLAQEALISVSEQTGGLAVINANPIDGLRRIAIDTSQYYLLGYATDAAASPGRFRRLEVRVKRPGLVVRARRGFVAADAQMTARLRRQAGVTAQTSPSMAAALTHPLPLDDVPMRVAATPFNDGGRAAAVLVIVEVDGRGLEFRQAEGRFHQTLDIALVASDHRGKVTASRAETSKIALLPGTYERVRQDGLRFLLRMELPSGRQQLRVGIHEAVRGSTGLVFYDLDVPDYQRSPVILGWPVLSVSPDPVATPKIDEGLQETFVRTPTARREFRSTDTLSVFGELHVRSNNGPANATRLVTTVRDARDSRVVFSSEDRGGAGRSAGGLSALVTVPLASVGPGEFVLRVEATVPGVASPAAREVPFQVRGS